MVTTNELISQIENYIAQNGGQTTPYGWYVGITSDPERRLFTEHRVNRNDGPWIYGPTSSEAEARQVEQYFLTRGYHGGTGGGDQSAIYVYAYRIAWYTVE